MLLFKEKGDKNAISPIIATVLLIALVLVLAAIVFLWARGFITEQIEKSVGDSTMSADEACSQIEFDFELIQGVTTQLEVVNQGNIPIYSFDIKKFAADGNSVVEKFDLQVDPGTTAREDLSFDVYGAQKLIIYPAILGNVKGKSASKIYTCTEKGVEKSLL